MALALVARRIVYPKLITIDINCLQSENKQYKVTSRFVRGRSDVYVYSCTFDLLAESKPAHL